MSARRDTLLAAVTVTAVLAWASHHWLGGATVGGDYRYFLPQLLGGCYFVRQNPITAVPWFTPAMLGGMPWHPNPQGVFYSLPQALALAVGPLRAVQLSTVLAGLFGALGMARLARRAFGVGDGPAALAAVVFALNGASLARVAAGHLTFQAFLAAPWVLLGCAPDAEHERFEVRRDGPSVLLAAACLSLMLHGGFVLGMAPVACAVVACVALRAVVLPDRARMAESLGRSLAVLGLAGALSASKALAAWAFLKEFPRPHYARPTFDGVTSSLLGLCESLTLGASQASGDRLVHGAFRVGRHELEFGLTVVPFVWIAAGLIAQVRGPRDARPRPSWIAALGLLASLAVPLLATSGLGLADAVVARTPVVRDMFLLVRLWLAYVPVVAIGCALGAERVLRDVPRAAVFLSLSLPLVGALQAASLEDLRDPLAYSPAAVEAAWRRLHAGAEVPRVTRLTLSRDAHGMPGTPTAANETFLDGASQLLPYEPLFGYRLETLPVGTLREGPTQVAYNGIINVRNPACMVFPRENGCAPGASYRLAEAPAARALIRWKTPAFKRPWRQRVADGVTVAAWAALVLALLVWSVRAVRTTWAMRR